MGKEPGAERRKLVKRRRGSCPYLGAGYEGSSWEVWKQ